MAETALEWTNRVFESFIDARDGVPKIILFASKGSAAKISVTVERFASMFAKTIESKKFETDLDVAAAIAARKEMGYASFIGHCKSKGIFG